MRYDPMSADLGPAEMSGPALIPRNFGLPDGLAPAARTGTGPDAATADWPLELGLPGAEPGRAPPVGELALPAALYRGRGKRALDIAFCLLILPVLVLICLVIWPLARLDGGPAFYSQPRVGRGGVPFTCWKFRTMVPDAERALARHLAADPQARREWQATRKLRRDPRVTRVGRVLRALSLDEIPQFWNVLRGDMSVVGPRPVQADELERYGRHLTHYLSVRPGVTGLWQVHGRDRVSYAERVRMDVAYSRDLGLMTDLGLIMQTVFVVLARRGV